MVYLVIVIIIVVVLVKKRRAKVAEGNINVSDMVMIQEDSPKKRKKNNFDKELAATKNSGEWIIEDIEESSSN